MSQSKILFFLSLSFIVGVFLESFIEIPHIFIWGFLLFGIILIIFTIFNSKINLISGFCLLFLVSGILRMQISEFNINKDYISKFNDGGIVTFSGFVNNEPDIRDTFQKIKVKVNNSIVLITTKRYPEYKYLDEIKITGNLETPGIMENGEVLGSYKNYLMKDHIYSVMNFPKIEVISVDRKYDIFSWVYDKILFLKQKIRTSIRNNFLPPQSSILEGTILGDNGAMDSELKNKLNITGLRHIIAVSGTHVIILSSIIFSLLLSIGLWRGQAFYITIFIVCIYIFLTGLPPSGIRAGIMGGTYLLSQKIGRQSIGLRPIVLTCFIMLTINPLLLIYDIGFQLSFLAVIGLIYLSPVLEKLIKLIIKYKNKNNKVEGFINIISTTFAAQIFTMPVMIYNFGNISLVSPITNLLVLPIVYWLMIFGFLSAVLGIFSNVIGWLLSIPCWFLLSYFVWIIDIFSQPWMIKIVQNLHWGWLIISYIIIVCTTAYLNKKYILKMV